MRKRIKKVGCIFLSAVILLIFSVYSSAQEAAVYANQTLEYWNAYTTNNLGSYPTEKIAYWDSPIRVYCESAVSEPSMSLSQLRIYANTANTTWASLGLDFSIVSSRSSANLILSAVSSTRARDSGIEDGMVGYTNLIYTGSSANTTMSGIGTYEGAQKTIYEITGTVLVELFQNSSIDDDTDFTSRHRVAIHELSHAFGYVGHSLYPTHLMYDTPPYPTGALTTMERNHLKQIYDQQVN